MCRVIWRIDQHGTDGPCDRGCVSAHAFLMRDAVWFNRASITWIVRGRVAWLPTIYIAERRGMFSSFSASEGVWDGKACGNVYIKERKKECCFQSSYVDQKRKKCM
jgi:hypothetical protein